MMDDTKNLPAPSETQHFVQPMEPAVAGTDSLPAGTPLGHYIIKKYIGGGGMGRVYLATDTALDRDVAIKVLPQQRAGESGTVARFMNEARSAARLNHEHIAQVYFAGEESGVPYIAFEYVEGINVRTMIEEHDVFPLPQALNYLLQITHALAHAATHGVVHRDVKPSNILITREGRAKLIDMGLARLLDTEADRDDLTASGVTLGTFDYISPEQARDPRNADIRSDIYSLGCTFFFMLTGRPPFPDGTVLQKLLQHQGDVPPDIRSFQPSIPAEIAFIIQKMMAKDPRQRFQTPTVLINALTDAARRLGMRPARQGNLGWTPTRAGQTSLFFRQLPWMASVLMLFIGYFVMTFFSERFFTPLRPETMGGMNTTNQPPEGVPPLAVPVAGPAFPVSLVSYSVAKPFAGAGLHPKAEGGGLQSALTPGMIRWQDLNGGSLNIAHIKPVSQQSTPQPTSPAFETRRIDPTGNTPGAYLSFAAALNGAADGTEFELKWTGIHRISEPIPLNRRKLQFTAAEGCEPVLLFEPVVSHTRRLFSVFSSDLKFTGVSIIARLNPGLVLAHWSLFELAGNSRLTFDKCCLTLQNRSLLDETVYHSDVVLFRNSVPANSDVVEGGDTTGDAISEPLTIEVSNSFLRGETVAIQSDVQQDIRGKFTNVLITLAKPFIQAKESRRATKQAAIKIEWEKVLFWGNQGVVDMSKETTDGHIIVEFESKQSVFVLNSFPFAVFQGMREQRDVLAEFQWSGTNNYFQGVSGLRFQAQFSPPDIGSTDITLDEWQKHWKPERELPKVDTLTLAAIYKPMSRILPQDIRSVFGSTDGVLILDFSVIPIPWNND